MRKLIIQPPSDKQKLFLKAETKHIGFGEDEWIEVVKETVPPKTIEINTKAFNAGYAY